MFAFFLRKDARGWLTSPSMQMGLDLPSVVFIILLRPPTHLEDILQSVGRGGRKQPDGKTSQVILITLFNMEDISDNISGMTPEVRQFCLESGCLRKFLNGAFGGRDLGPVDPAMCCGPCSGMDCIRA